MALETATHINDLVTTNPDGLDDVSQGDNHIRMVKDVLKRDLPLTTPATALGMSLLTAASAQSALSAIGGSNSPFRNILINGGFGVDTRGSYSSSSITAGAALKYFIDRWYAYCTGGNITAASSDRGTLPYPTVQLAGSASNSGTGLGHRIESRNSYQLAGNTATLSARLFCGTGTVAVTWSAYYANTADTFGTIASPTRTFIASGTFTATTTSTVYSANIAIPAGATTGLEIVFMTAAIAVGQSISYQQIQLEYGTLSTSQIQFENVDLPIETLRCQRYYLKTTCTARAYASIAGQSIDAPIYFPAQMRATPTATFITGTGTVVNVSSESVVGITNQSATFSIQSTSTGDSLAVDRAYSFSAEL